MGLVLILLSVLSISWMVENPAGSTILLHPVLQWAIRILQAASAKAPSPEPLFGKHLIRLGVFFSGVAQHQNLSLLIFVGLPYCLKAYFAQCSKRPTCTCTAQIYRVLFWMRHYGSPSMKRTMVICNNRVLCSLDRGQVSKKRRSTAKPTTKRYKSKEGKTRFVGTSRLKQSQILVWFEEAFCC